MIGQVYAGEFVFCYGKKKHWFVEESNTVISWLLGTKNKK